MRKDERFLFLPYLMLFFPLPPFFFIEGGFSTHTESTSSRERRREKRFMYLLEAMNNFRFFFIRRKTRKKIIKKLSREQEIFIGLHLGVVKKNKKVKSSWEKEEAFSIFLSSFILSPSLLPLFKPKYVSLNDFHLHLHKTRRFSFALRLCGENSTGISFYSFILRTFSHSSSFPTQKVFPTRKDSLKLDVCCLPSLRKRK